MEIYNNAGQSFFEVVVAMAMISIVLVTLVAMGSLSIRSSVFARNQTEANRYTQQAVEWLRLEKDNGWTNFSQKAGANSYCLDSGSVPDWNTQGTCPAGSMIPGTIFTRFVSFTNVPGVSIKADITTQWSDGQGTHSATSSVIFTNFK